MLFNSFEFFAFFVTFLVVFFSLPPRTQPFVLLIGSYIFYMGWRPSYALLLALTTVVDYTTGLMMARDNGGGLHDRADDGAGPYRVAAQDGNDHCALDQPRRAGDRQVSGFHDRERYWSRWNIRVSAA